MKIVIRNSSAQYALSRKQIAEIFRVLPEKYSKSIKSFNLIKETQCPEKFEYNKEHKVVWFSCPVAQKSSSDITNAVEELLIGIARIECESDFFKPFKQKQRNNLYGFVRQWLNQCLKAIGIETV